MVQVYTKKQYMGNSASSASDSYVLNNCLKYLTESSSYYN